jgi:LysM repeat protein
MKRFNLHLQITSSDHAGIYEHWTGLVIVALLVLGLAGCKSLVPAPGNTPTPHALEPTLAQTFIATATPTQTLATPVPENVAPQVVGTTSPQPVGVSPQPGGAVPQPGGTATAEGTPTSCPPPSGWLAYTIQTGDTLFSLANWSGASVNELMQRNCLEGSLIFPGQVIYLPALPPPPAPPAAGGAPPSGGGAANPPGPEATEPPFHDCESAFDCPNPIVMGLDIGPNSPNQGFIPCSENKSGVWISSDKLTVEQGLRAYFYACNFPQNATLTVEVSGPVGAPPPPVHITDTIPNPDIQSKAIELNWDFDKFKVVTFFAVCNLPLGPYTITVKDDQSPPAQYSFDVIAPDPILQYILPVPQAGTAGTRFDVWFCNYRDYAGKKVLMDLFYEFSYLGGQNHHFGAYVQTFVQMNNAGWSMIQLQSKPGDIARAYYILDHDSHLNGENFIWITPH